MEISRGMIDYYLGKITVHWFDYHELPASKLEDYLGKAIYIKEIAEENNDLRYLEIGLNFLLCHPEINLEDHGYSYSWTDGEVREIVAYIRSIIFPETPSLNCADAKNVVLANTTIEEWWTTIKSKQLSDDCLGRSGESGEG